MVNEQVVVVSTRLAISYLKFENYSFRIDDKEDAFPIFIDWLWTIKNCYA